MLTARGGSSANTPGPGSKQPHRKYLTRGVVLFALAVVAEITFLSILPEQYRKNENSDYWTFYKPVGENILAGNGMVDANGQLATTYPPGYPAAMALVFGAADLISVSRTTMIDIFDIFLTALSALVVCEFSRSVFGWAVAYISFFLWISYPANLWLIKQPNSEVPFIFGLLVSLHFFFMAVTKKLPVLGFIAGLLLGMAALIRPIGIFLPVLFVFAAMLCPSMIHRNRAKLAILVTAGFLVSVLPWEGYLYAKTGQLPLLCTNGPATMSEGLVFAIEPIPGSKSIWVPAHLRALMQQATLERPSMRTAESVLKFAARQATINPLGTLQLALMKLYRPWYATYSRRQDKLNFAYQLFYVPLALVGMIVGRRRYRSQVYWIGVLSGLVLYFWGMAFLVIPLFRYMVPPMTFMLIFCAIAIEPLVNRVKAGLPRIGIESEATQ